MKEVKNILVVVGVILGLLISIFVTSKVKDKTLEKQKIELRKQILRNDKLVKINASLYSKKVADTLKLSKLKKLNDSLKLQLKNPKIVTVIKIKLRDQIGEVEGIVVKDSIISIKDFYPNKKDFFIKYSADINTITKEGVGTFTMDTLNINFGIGQNSDGTYSLNTQVPDFINITSIDVQALPMAPIKKDNFGVLLGAGLGRDFNNQSVFLTIGTALRFKKVYLELQGNTNKTISTGLKFEF